MFLLVRLCIMILMFIRDSFDTIDCLFLPMIDAHSEQFTDCEKNGTYYVSKLFSSP